MSQRQSLATSAERLDGGSRRRDEVVYSNVLFDSVHFSSGRPALESWTADDGDEVRIVQLVVVRFTSVLAELERTTRGTDGNRRVPPSDGG